MAIVFYTLYLNKGDRSISFRKLSSVRVLQSKKLSQNSTLLKVENFISGSLARKILSKSYIHSSNWIFHFSPAFSQKYAKNLKILIVFLKILRTVENLGILRKS